MNDFIFGAILVIIFSVFFFLLIKKWKTDEKQSEALRDLERRVTDLVLQIKGSVDHTSQAMYQQISSFTKESVQMREQLSQLQQEMRSISSFQEIFKTPKLRGEWGEANLEYLLSEYFPKEFYIKNFSFSSGAQVEFALKLPNKKILPIDAKFFSENFEKIKTARTEEEADFFRKRLIQDIKNNIQTIASKYIVPAEGTVDFALMFIPAEAIFYEIMFNLKDEDIASYARSKKVVLVSPNTIYLTLRTIIDWFRDIQISRQTQEILKRLDRLQTDAEKLMEDFRKLGLHLRNATASYEGAEKRLSLFADRVEKLTKFESREELPSH